MPRTYFTFGDIEGKIDVLRIECTRCDRKGRYSVAKLIQQHGRRGNLTKWASDCPKRDLHALARDLRPGLPRSAEGEQ